jgi:hypothetical protein
MKIYIHQKPGTILNEIFIVEEPTRDFRRGDVLGFLNMKPDGEVIVTQKVYGHGAELDMKPTMILDEMATRELIAAFAELAKDQGLEPDSESKAKGKLEATERHLADLQKLLKLK